MITDQPPAAAGRRGRRVVRGAAVAVRLAVLPFVVALGLDGGVSGAAELVERVGPETLLPVVVVVAAAVWAVLLVLGRRDAESGFVALGMAVVLLLLLPLVWTAPGRAALVVAALVVGAVADVVHRLAREVDPGQRGAAGVYLRAVLASATVSTPPLWLLRLWASTGELPSRLRELDELVATAESVGRPLRGGSLTGVPRLLRWAGWLLPSRPPSPVPGSWDETIAWHEAGHTVAGWLVPELLTPVVVTVEAHETVAAGATVHLVTDGPATRATHVWAGVVAWAGFVAESMRPGLGGHPGAGHGGDVEQAERHARRLESLYGETWNATAWQSATSALLAGEQQRIGAVAKHLTSYGGCGLRDLHRLLGPRPGTPDGGPLPVPPLRPTTTGKAA